MLGNKILADKNKIDKNEAENHMVAGLVTLALQFYFFFVWGLSNLVFMGMFLVFL